MAVARLLRVVCFMTLLPACGAGVPATAQSTVVLEQQEGRFRLLRNGQPYTIKGVGGSASLRLLQAAGGNSLRTWSTEGLGTLLDEAQRHDLTVCVGLWLGHPRHGFDYHNEQQVLDQLEKCLAAVQRYHDHPAVLLWGIGNEMEGDGTDPAVWYAVNHIAREVKRIDPHHPTMTVIAELGDHKLASIKQFCPDIDIVGVNSYGGVATLAERYREAEIGKSYIVTEHGPRGPWEVEQTSWGAPLEATSTQKALRYGEGYQRTAGEDRDRCLGTYAFLWGEKQESTATWFGMLLPDGRRLAAVDAMSEAWTGRPPRNRCPEIAALTLDAADALQPGQQVQAEVTARDPDGDPLTVTWVLRADLAVIGNGGDPQAVMPEFPTAVTQGSTETTLTVPEGGGGYRLFAYVSDDHGGAAVANVPCYVDAPVKPLAAPPAELPFTLYAEAQTAPPFVPSGFMGNVDALHMELDHPEDPRSGKSCLRARYVAGDEWGGVLWQSPAQDWKGERPGGLDFRGATAVEFWARGDRGGEIVSFVVGAIQGDQPYVDSATAELPEVHLTDRWQQYRIPLGGRDLHRIKTAFGWSVAGQGEPLTFYLDDIRYVSL